jgi:hypothetical protein
MSLDYRLRDASNVREMVVQLLDDLSSDLKEGDSPFFFFFGIHLIANCF